MKARYRAGFAGMRKLQFLIGLILCFVVNTMAASACYWSITPGSENNYTATFTYNDALQRAKMELKKNGTKELNRYYISDCYEIDDRAVGGVLQKLYLGGDYYSAPAVYVKDGSGSWQLYYIFRDYQGSITHITSSSGSQVQELSYDAWGSLRNPANQVNYAPGSEPALFLGRGYTGHEHLPMFGLINMNARLYDPAVGRFLSPDPDGQAPDMTQNFNRYSYVLNNPLAYTDPNGELFNPFSWKLIAAAWGLFSDAGYKAQKQISPVAVKLDVRFGSNQGGIGIDASIGIPQAGGLSYRVHGGATYFWKNTDLMGNNLSGWETRYGSEWGIGFIPSSSITYSGTTFNSDWSGRQTTNLMSSGNLRYENDMEPEGLFKYIPLVPKGDGDRYRTAAVQMNFGPIGIGTNMITGDAGPDRSYPNNRVNIDGHDTYAPNNGYNPNSHRMGTLYFKAGPFRFGRNSEGIRKVLQNQFAHDLLTGGKSKWFEVLDLKPKWYWGFGYSGGGTLW